MLGDVQTGFSSAPSPVFHVAIPRIEIQHFFYHCTKEIYIDLRWMRVPSIVQCCVFSFPDALLRRHSVDPDKRRRPYNTYRSLEGHQGDSCHAEEDAVSRRS